jgi:peptidoglycan L-alanyl-D-glutamate endopeptidase CwlK
VDANSEARLSLVWPKVAELARQLYTRLQQENLDIHIVQGFRSWNDQQALWAKGRDAQGNVIDHGAVVTNAPPGHSWHEFGMAIDVCPFVDGKPDWDLANPAWKRIVAVGESLGFYSGSHFVHPKPDWPHLQLTGRFPVSPDGEARQIFKDAGMEAVWQEALI